MTFHRLISKLSVRTRIITIAFIPVLGLLANGLAFTSGETEVQSAFGSVGEANALADASRDFKGAPRHAGQHGGFCRPPKPRVDQIISGCARALAQQLGDLGSPGRGVGKKRAFLA